MESRDKVFPVTLLATTTIFSGSFLLFLVQPMFARLILPDFGSSAAVWVTCLAAYEALLVAGYAWGAKLASVRKRRSWPLTAHVAGLFAAAAWIALLAARGPVVIETENAWTGVVLTVCACVAAPYVLLSANATTVQALFPAGKNPFWLYGVSNLGSFCGLMAFPLVLEPEFPVNAQLGMFAVGLAAYASLVVALARCAERTASSWNAEAGVQNCRARRGAFVHILWIAIPAASSALLASMTTFVCADVAPLPLLWVVFLGVFLLSYVLGFNTLAEKALPALGMASVLAMFPLAGLVETATDFSLTSLDMLCKVESIGIAAFGIVLLFLHTWLYSLRPNREQMGKYYLFNAVGGSIGGIFAGIVAPQVFDRIAEYPLSLFVSSTLVGAWAASAAAQVAMMIGKRLLGFPVKRLSDGGLSGYTASLRSPLSMFCPMLVLALVLFWAMVSPKLFRCEVPGTIRTGRDFYGALAVVEGQKIGGGEGKMLLNGRTHHGIQIAVPQSDKMVPTTYYGDTGGGIAVKAWRAAHGEAPMRFASVGLGVGTMAAWASPGDKFEFIEISSEVIGMASDPSLFTFLAECAGDLEIKCGDGRKILENEAEADDKPWDILEIDAFSGDAIPMQLITDEAFDLYLDRLAPDGILAVHASSWQFDLLPVMKRQMERLGLDAVATVGLEDRTRYLDTTQWVFFSRKEPTETKENKAQDPCELLDTLFPGMGGTINRTQNEPRSVPLGVNALPLPPGTRTVSWRLVANCSPITDTRGSLLQLIDQGVKNALFGGK